MDKNLRDRQLWAHLKSRRTNMRTLSPCACGCVPKIKHGYHKECLDFGLLVWIQCPACGIASRQYVDRDDSDVQTAVDSWNRGEQFQYDKQITDKWIEKEDVYEKR